MGKLLLVAIVMMMAATGCSREVYINKQSEIIRERETSSDVVRESDTSSDVRIIDREKEVYDRERRVVKERKPSKRPIPVEDSGYQTVVD
jgi:hypothetical protein